MSQLTFRAAFIGDVRLTAPEHAGLSDEALLAEAHAEADRTDPLHGTDADGNPVCPRDSLQIGEWSE